MSLTVPTGALPWRENFNGAWQDNPGFTVAEGYFPTRFPGEENCPELSVVLERRVWEDTTCSDGSDLVERTDAMDEECCDEPGGKTQAGCFAFLSRWN